ncbi:DEAD/DEAH box helicase [Phreatobacter stygius]|uniref:DEAD/DEAH box helicase n=2 Tax=Pseudomonadota TaxID=1224 RepID=A0A4D7B006_9HYPH|nr:DEAD/DEAH box helicase [Phreatobacter stygius]QCI65991.1 DEAD/DEAH box helicase [Phreatobacter stygius]
MTELPISPPLARALAERDYTELTPVQSGVMGPQALDRDLLVSAQTGSGKTVAYGLGLAHTLLGDEERIAPAGDPMALIIAPTRELALQVQRELAWLYAQTGARVVACVGGMDPRRERRMLDEGAHIVVGTPGRLRDHIERNALNPYSLKAVVLDEADEMLDLGFRDDLEFILNTTPENRRTLLFSATLPAGIVTLAKRFQRNAFRIEASRGERGGHIDIEYRAIRVVPNEVEHAVVNVLRQVESPSAIVFCNTRNAVRHLQSILVERGFSAVFLSGELGQHERNMALQALRDGRARICVATDVAARGIDLPNLGLVIHAELPNDAEILQHRSGRTGRAGRKGISVMIVPPARNRRAETLLANAGIKAQWSGPPTADEIRKLDGERLLLDPLLTDEPSEEDRQMAETLLAHKSADDIAAAFARVLRGRLPEPEEVTMPSMGREPRGAKERVGGARDRDDDRPARSSAGMAWFRLDAGRENNADPKWILPMLCRRGKVTRQDIGAIRIFDDVTEFEVSEAVAEEFAISVRRANAEDIYIEPMTEAPGQRGPAGPARKFAGKPAGKPFGKGEGKPPRDAKPFKDARPAREGKPFKAEGRPFGSDDGKPAGKRPPQRPTGKAERGGFKHRKGR